MSQGASSAPLESTEAQMAGIMAIIVANLLSLLTLQGNQNRQEGRFPCQDYSWLEQLPRVSTVITLAVSLYFLWLAWRQYRQQPRQTAMVFLLLANALTAGAILLKADVLFFLPQQDIRSTDFIDAASE